MVQHAYEHDTLALAVATSFEFARLDLTADRALPAAQHLASLFIGDIDVWQVGVAHKSTSRPSAAASAIRSFAWSSPPIRHRDSRRRRVSWSKIIMTALF